MTSIRKLLSKKGWTGKDVGKTLIACLLHDLQHLEDATETAPLLTQAEFERMEASLATERDFTTYRVYVALHESLREFYNKANSYLQQIYHGLYRIIPVLSNYHYAGKESLRAREAILHLTPAQYDQVNEKIVRTFKAKTRTKTGLKFLLLRAFLGTQKGKHKAAATVPEAIQKELDALAKKPATNKQALSAWIKRQHLGGHVLPDGRYKEDVEEAEAAAILAKYTPARAVQQAEAQALFYAGADAIRKAYKEATGESLPECSDALILFCWQCGIGAPSLADMDAKKGESPALEETIRTKLYALQDGSREYALEWKFYDVDEVEAPTKRELLEECLEYYEGATEDTDPAAGFRAFKKDYPALNEALEQELLARLPELKKIKPAQAHKPAITCGELMEKGFLDFAEVGKASQRDIIEACNYRSFADTIALVSNISHSDLDENGNYKSKPLVLWEYTAGALAVDGADDMQAAVELLIMPAMRYIYAYNAWLDLIENAYDIQDLQPAKVETAAIEARLHAMNGLIYTYYLEAENAEERALVKRAFTPLPVDRLHPQEEAIEEAARELESLGYTTAAAKAFSLVNVNATIKRIAGL